MGEMIPIVAIVLSVGLPLSIPIVFLVLSYRKRRRLMELHHVERMAAIERGMEIPPLPMDVLDLPPAHRRSALLPGLIWLFVGLALTVGLYEWNDFGGFAGFSVWGLVPTGVGIAYLIYYFVEDRKAREQDRKRGSAPPPKENP